ncbi:MAG: polysulfide reductase NrfD [Rhodospirillales bacterium]|jgi:formate-dependent nitrite reductase membrane component NrfD|nr:polysulfide reductase NrfD [Rhodospirillales bacterium]
MTEGLLWGMPVIGYLFLAGVGAGAMTVSASMYLRGGSETRGMHVDTARYGAFLAPIPIMVGCGLLIFELGSFEVGNWLKWLNLYKVINLSPMSIGTWLLTVTIGVSVVYAYTYVHNAPGLPDDRRYALRRALSWAAVPLGVATAVYTGILLGAMPSRPFWNSPILALLFLVSSLSTGVAVILLARALIHRKDADSGAERHFEKSGYILTASDTLLIGFEIMVIFLFLMFGYLTVGDVKEAVQVVLAGGSLATLFWLGFVVIGLVVPVLVELYYVMPKLLYHREYVAPRGVEIVVSVVVLFGGFLLRYIVVIAGQITGPVGV